MSALGQKQTLAPQKVMSALPPKADIRGAKRNVCFGPIADIPGIWPSHKNTFMHARSARWRCAFATPLGRKNRRQAEGQARISALQGAQGPGHKFKAVQ